MKQTNNILTFPKKSKNTNLETINKLISAHKKKLESEYGIKFNQKLYLATRNGETLLIPQVEETKDAVLEICEYGGIFN